MKGKHRQPARPRESGRLRIGIAYGAGVALVALGGIAVSAAVSSPIASQAASASRQASEQALTVAFRGGPALPPAAGGTVSQLTASPDCTLQVPQNPLSAQGLMTPYVLGSAGRQCSEANEGLAAFVEATIFDPATGALSVYDPAVRDAGQPLLGSPPDPVTLPPGAVVTVWTGFNGNVLKLTGPGHGQFASFAQQGYANSPQFYAAVNAAVHSGKTIVPALGTGSDGMTCPSTRDFSVVDQDQSDNTTVGYPAYGVTNGSDDALLQHIQAALGCSRWTVAGGTSGALEELQAAYAQAPPQALVPSLDPFVLSNGQPSVFLQNLYRLQLDQPAAGGHDTAAYCQNLLAIGEPRLKADQSADAAQPAPQFAPIGTDLSLVLAARFEATWGNLDCQALTGQSSPITVMTDGNGVAVSAAYA